MNKDGEQRIATAGNVERRFFHEFVLDYLNRTENAMTQHWVFTVTELALRAQRMAAVGEHQPAPWTGKTVLIRNSASDPLLSGTPQDVTDYWQRLSLGDLTVVDTTGDHFSCITQQHAASLADCIARHARPEEAL